MASQRASIGAVGICLKPDSKPAGEAAREIASWLTERGVTIHADPFAADWLAMPPCPRSELARRAGLLVVIGGDGTLLAVARESGPAAVPILGVNQGSLGFLAEVAPEEVQGSLGRILAGDFETVSRMRFEVAADRAGELLGQHLALNDAVITRSELSRVLDIETRIDGVPVTTYHGDGLIVATPTGSTAYSLSAGGPIVHPALDAIVLTPVCPHTLSQRPIVLPATASVEARVVLREGSAQLTVDGQEGLTLQDGDRITVCRSDHPAQFVVSPYRSRFDVLRSKLRWGAD
jgi:NAD+ kinase